MIVLDENITDSQRLILRARRIRARQIGVDIGTPGIKDDSIPKLLRELSRPTFITRDVQFYDWRRCDRHYAMVLLAVGQEEVASFVKRSLRHPRFNTNAKRLGLVVRVTRPNIHFWRVGAEFEEVVHW